MHDLLVPHASNTVKMKKIITLLLVLSSIVSTQIFAAETAAIKYVSIEDAMLKPGFTNALELDLTEMNANKFYQNAQKFTALNSIRITKCEGKHQLKAFLNSAAAVPQLKRLDLPVANVNELPDEIKFLTSLEEVHLIPGELEGWVKNAYVHVDYVDDGRGKNDFNFVVYNTETLDDRSISKLVRCYPDALVQQLPPERTPDFVYAPGKYKTVRPPIPGLDIQQNSYSVNADDGSKIYYKSGTVLDIPANAFVDKDGKIITGEVMMNYREFRDPIEILASGIPMNYDSAGSNTWFTSGGMFELTASFEGEEVFMNPNTTVKVDLATTDPDTDFNLYHLDAESGQWVYDNSNVNTVVLANVQPLSRAWAYFNYGNASGLMTREYDNKTFDERWESDDYSFLYKKNEDNSALIYRLPNRMVLGKKYLDWSAQPEIRLEVVDGYQKNRGTVTFDFDASEKTHPELRAFANMVWEYSGDLTRLQFKSEFVNRKVYHDFRLTYNEQSANFTIEMKTEDGRVSFDAVPSFRTKAQEEAQHQSELKKRNAQYTAAVTRKAKFFNREMRRFEKKFNLQKNHAWFSISLQMSDAEKKMTRETWLEYYKVISTQYSYLLDQSNVDMMETYMSMEQDRGTNRRIAARNERRSARTRPASRSFNINLFGLINIDKSGRPFERVNTPQGLANTAGDMVANRPVAINASFTNREGQRIDVRSVFVLTKGHNGVLRYDVGIGQQQVEMLFNPTMETTIVALNAQGKLSVLKPRAVNRLNIGRGFVANNVLEMTEIKKDFTSIERLRKEL
jgi:hypothetical protein